MHCVSAVATNAAYCMDHCIGLTPSVLQSQYNDYITAIILRKNSITGRLYRDDPNVGSCYPHSLSKTRLQGQVWVPCCKTCPMAAHHALSMLHNTVTSNCLQCCLRCPVLTVVHVQILAWDIINEPANPGDTSGDVLFVSHCWFAAVQLQLTLCLLPHLHCCT